MVHSPPHGVDDPGVGDVTRWLQHGAFPARRPLRDCSPPVRDRLGRPVVTPGGTPAGPAHLGILRTVGQHPRLSQKALSERVNAVPSRMVKLLDELEERGLVERRRSESDRRHHELYISPAAGPTMKVVMSAVVENDAAVTRALTDDQRRDLVRLLSAIADEQGLSPETRPGPGAPR